jgi:large subunit ribosomal protein L7e
MAERYKITQDAGIPEGVAIPENTKKKLVRNAELADKKKDAVTAATALRKEQRHSLKMRTLKFEKEYKMAQGQLVAQRREAKAAGNFFVEPEPKLLFVMRITGINKLAPKPRKILQLLRLRQLHNGVFLKVSKPMMNMLKYIQPYVTYGYPNLKTVKELIYKRGFGKVEKQRIPLMDNQIITDKLGQYGIHGMEDLVHEIYTVGPNFKQASNFLWPFKLSAPRKGFVNKRHGYAEPKGGDWGNREELLTSSSGA